MTIDPFSDWDAAYVLGALSIDERRQFERHFASCAPCGTAVAELAGIPGILTKIDTATAVALANASSDGQVDDARQEPDLIQKLARLVGEQQRRTRRRLSVGMAAAAVLIVFGILAGTAMHSPTHLGTTSNIATGTEVAMTPLQVNVMTADLRVTSKPWGTRFDWSCKYVGTWSARYSPKSYDLVITNTSGQKITIATWSSAGPNAAGLAATSNLPIADIRTIEIRATGSTTPLVRGEV